jgi:hypothetical protein
VCHSDHISLIVSFGFLENAFFFPFVLDPNADVMNSLQDGFFSLNQGFSRLWALLFGRQTLILGHQSRSTVLGRNRALKWYIGVVDRRREITT